MGKIPKVETAQMTPRTKQMSDPEYIKISDNAIRYHERDIIKVTLPDGKEQPFYRSSGHNSGRPGVWFPFDGCVLYMGGWFDKGRFTQPDGVLLKHTSDRHHLHRFGTEQLLSISNQLGAMTIPQGREVLSPLEVNAWLYSENLAKPLSYTEAA